MRILPGCDKSLRSPFDGGQDERTDTAIVRALPVMLRCPGITNFYQLPAIQYLVTVCILAVMQDNNVRLRIQGAPLADHTIGIGANQRQTQLAIRSDVMAHQFGARSIAL